MMKLKKKYILLIAIIVLSSIISKILLGTSNGSSTVSFVPSVGIFTTIDLIICCVLFLFSLCIICVSVCKKPFSLIFKTDTKIESKRAD